MARPPKGVKNDAVSTEKADCPPREKRVWLGELLALRLAGQHLVDGIDPDDHVRDLREGWDPIQDSEHPDAEA